MSTQMYDLYAVNRLLPIAGMEVSRMVEPDFPTRFFGEFFKSIHANQTDNWDARRFGLENRGFSHEAAAFHMRFTLANLDHYAWVYGQLADAASREYLLRFMLYKILGHTHVRFPQNTPEFWRLYKSIESHLLCHASKPFPSQFLPVPMYVNRYSVSYHGNTIDVNTSDILLLEALLLDQYYYRNGGVEVAVQPGDIVIDAGACWGEASLGFSALAGKQGRVFAFEMIDENLAVFRNNLAQNPDLAEIIEIVESPLAAGPDREYWVTAKGPASRLERESGRGKRVMSNSIDHFVQERNLPTVNFIKFDIEGAEEDALLGAKETISRHKPALAVSVYHRNEDIIKLPRIIKAFHPGYSLYLHGVSLNYGESILFARA